MRYLGGKIQYGLSVHRKLSALLAPNEGERGALITVLQKAQEELGYLLKR